MSDVKTYTNTDSIRILIVVMLFVLAPHRGSCESFSIDTNFAGGNIFVENISGDTLFVRPDLRDTEGEWFYWYFKIRGAENRLLTVQFTQSNVFSSAGPVLSRDGRNWSYLDKNCWQDGQFQHSFSERDSCLSFAVAIPYTQHNWDQFLTTLLPNEKLAIDTLCFSRENRPVERLTISPPERAPQYRVLITARHHACEMMANYVIEGLILTILESQKLQWCREQVEFTIIPFVDKDGVEDGDQGKNRKPRDHGRDYEGESLYKSTAAIRAQIPAWSDGKLALVLDIHCPWIKGQYNEFIYIVGSASQDNAKEQIKFSQLLQEQNVSELPFSADDLLPFGTAWNTGDNYAKGISLSKWGRSLKGVSLSTSLEFPYTTVYDKQVTVENARGFGETIASAMQEYLRRLKK